jgi:hypothetical protein
VGGVDRVGVDGLDEGRSGEERGWSGREFGVRWELESVLYIYDEWS